MRRGAPKRLWFVIGGFILLFTVVFVVRSSIRSRQLSTYFDRLRPEMSYWEVTQFMPRAMITSDKQRSTSVVWRTILVRSNAVPAAEIYCTGKAFPLGGAETGIIYFDEQDRLIGAYYSCSGGGGWAPKWGAANN